MLTVIDRAGINNAIDDDVEEFIVEGKHAQKLVRTLKAAKIERAISIPGSIISVFVCPPAAVFLILTRLYGEKIVKYDYKIVDSQKVEFKMHPEEVEKLRKKEEKRKAKGKEKDIDIRSTY